MLVPSIFKNSFFDNIFDDMFTAPFGLGSNRTGMMSTDVQELDDRYKLDIELPGYAKEDIKAELNAGYLILMAEHKEEREENDNNKSYIRRERYCGQCQRSFYVGDEVKEEDIRASFKDGILKLEIPKIKKKQQIEQKKYIEIE